MAEHTFEGRDDRMARPGGPVGNGAASGGPTDPDGAAPPSRPTGSDGPAGAGSAPEAAFDAETGPEAPRSTLTQEDVRLLAAAIRQGTTAPPPTGGDVLAELVKLVVVILVLVGVYEGLHRWHPNVAATYTGDAAGSLRSLVVRGGGAPVSWTLPGVYARSVALTGPADENATVGLPVRAQACRALARALGLVCDRRGLVASESIDLVWTSPQLLYLAPPGGPGGAQASDVVSFAVTSAGGNGPAPAPAAGGAGSTAPPRPTVQLSVTGTGPLDWCYGTPAGGATLALEVAGRPAVTIPADDLTGAGCTGGLAVTVTGHAAFADRRPPAVTFGQVSSLTFQATSGEVEAEDLGGLLHLGEAGTDSLSPAAVVHLATHGRSTVHTALALDGAAEQVTLASPRLADATSDGIQLVDSWWDRENSISVPLFLAVSATPLALLPALLGKSRRWGRAARAARAAGTDGGADR